MCGWWASAVYIGRGAGPCLGGAGRAAGAVVAQARFFGGLEHSRRFVLPCDSTQPETLTAARDALVTAWGGLDLVVYLAGGYEPMQADTLDVAVLEQVVDVNLHGAVRLTAAALPELKAGGGIALVASVAGYQGLPKALAYGSGKAALIHFAECLLHGPHRQRHWRAGDQPRLCIDTAHRQKRFQNARADHARAGGVRHHGGPGQRGVRDPFPETLHKGLKLLSLLPYRLYFPLVRRMTGA